MTRVTVSNEEELLAALRDSAEHELHIRLTGMIKATRTYVVPEKDLYHRHLNLVISGGGVDFSDLEPPADWWDHPQPSYRRNGFEVRCKRCTFRHSKFVGFNYQGQLLKIQDGWDFNVVRCRFEGIGQKRYPYRDDRPANSATDSIYTCSVGGTSARGLVVGNYYQDCSWQNGWGHCVYVFGGGWRIVGNTFHNCGDIASLGYPYRLLWDGNHLFDSHSVVNRQGKEVWPTILVLAGGDSRNTRLVDNVYDGRWYRYVALLGGGTLEGIQAEDNDYDRLDADWAYVEVGVPGGRRGWESWESAERDLDADFPDLRRGNGAVAPGDAAEEDLEDEGWVNSNLLVDSSL